MNFFGMCLLCCWSGSDGEEYVGNPEFFQDQLGQPEYTEKDKYSMGSTLMSYSLLIVYSFACV
jgi:hypothetical protein